jgi:hypothetical protein
MQARSKNGRDKKKEIRYSSVAGQKHNGISIC